MKIINHKINETGMEEIHKFLAENHKLGCDRTNVDMLNAWAAEAEMHADDGNGCYIELRASDSIHHRTQTHDISENGYDEIEVDLD